MFFRHDELVDVFLPLDLLVLQRLDDLLWHARTPRVVLVDGDSEDRFRTQVVRSDWSLVQELVANQRRVVRVASRKEKVSMNFVLGMQTFGARFATQIKSEYAND
jgi:hypothetical protein